MTYINLNGKIIPAADAHIPVDNGAFRYGHGLFETMLVQQGAIRLAAYHWERLLAGAGKLHFDMPPLMTAAWLQGQVLTTVRKNKLDHLCRVRLQLFAGGGGIFGRDDKPGLLIECFPLTPDTIALNENGLTIGIASGLSKSADSLANLKCCNALIYAMAAKQAVDNKWNDALITNTSGHIIESAISNIFWIKDGIIHTPPLTDGCIAGTMRRHLMSRMPVTEQSLTTGALTDAEEVFLTNAIRTIRWVQTLGDKTYRHNKARQIFAAL